MSENQADYITDAMKMLGSGYDDSPSVEIEKPRAVVERKGGKLVETERPAFVKIYTSFKDEMRDIDEIAMKVWLYIALSVNRDTGEAHPSLRTLSDRLGFAVNTIRSAIGRLEEKNLLVVERGERKYNRYFPADYVSARRETVSADDTDDKTVSAKGETVSPRVILNQINQNIKQQPEEPSPEKNAFSVYEQEIGVLTPMIADDIEAWARDASEGWVIDAIREAAANNKRNWRYCVAILKRWQAQKSQEPMKQGRKANAQSNGFDVIKNWLDKTTSGEVVNG